MGDRPKFINLVTTESRKPILTELARRAGGTSTTDIVPAHGKGPAYVLFRYVGDLGKLRQEIFAADQAARVKKKPGQ